MNEPIPSSAADNARYTASVRRCADLLLIWALCPRPACRRRQTCSGNPHVCMSKQGPMLPQGVRAWFTALGDAQRDGAAFDAAMAWLETTEAGAAFRDWHATVAAAHGGDPILEHGWWRAQG